MDDPSDGIKTGSRREFILGAGIVAGGASLAGIALSTRGAMEYGFVRAGGPIFVNVKLGSGGWRGRAPGAAQAFRRGDRRRRDRRDDPGGRVLLTARTVGLWQDDDAAPDRRVRAADRRPDPAGRRRRVERAAAPAQRQHGVPELRPVPVPQCL